MFRDRHHSLRSSLLVCSPPRSPLPLRHRPQGSRDFSIRAEPASLPSQASDMLAVRTRQLTAVGIELGRTHLRWRVSSPALSIAGWVHNSTIAMFPKAPRVIPDGGLSPVRLATMAVPWQPSRHRGGSSARPHPPLTTRFTPRLVDALPLSTLLRLSVR